MKVFSEIEFNFDLDSFKKKIRIGNNKELNKNLKNILNEVLPLIKPKAVYEVSYIDEKYEKAVKIENIKFESKVLSDKLKDIDRVFPYIVTCGDELNEYMEEMTDYLEKYWLDSLKEEALRCASRFLKNFIKDKYKIKQIASMNPGSGNINLWPIAEQKKLFKIFGDTEKLIGVKLTDSFLMLPNKSLSGIYFPVDIKFVNCQYCKRKNCPSRRAPYKGDH